MKNLNYKNALFLEDFSGKDSDVVRNKIVKDFEIARERIDEFQILVAYMSVGDYGCDSSAWLLLRDRKSGGLFEVHASHCSCYGFEGQFAPEPTTEAYLKSDKFSFSCGGYDNSEAANKKAVLDFLKAL